MQSVSRSVIACLALVCVLTASTPVGAIPRVLVYTRTAGFRHESIPTAVDTITALGNGTLSASLDEAVRDVRWETVNTEDDSRFRDTDYLAQFDAIGFVSTTDADPPATTTVLDDEGIANLVAYIEQGGGFFGVHSASATLFGAPPYGRLVGAFFDYHPQIQNVQVRPVTRDHPSTSTLPEGGFEIFEEVYQFRSDPRQLPSPANVLVTNASSYQDPGVNPQGFRNGTNGPSPLPLAWWREGRLLDSDADTDPSVSGGGGANIQATGGPGRSWYTSLGHDSATWATDEMRSHIAGGIGWVLLSPAVKSNNASAAVGQSQSNSTSTGTSNTNTGGGGSASTPESAATQSWPISLLQYSIVAAALLHILI